MSNPFAPQYHHDTRTAFGYRVRFKQSNPEKWVGLILLCGFCILFGIWLGIQFGGAA